MKNVWILVGCTMAGIVFVQLFRLALLLFCSYPGIGFLVLGSFVGLLIGLCLVE